MSTTAFSSINRGYSYTFQAGRLTVGLVVPIENYADSSVPSMIEHVERVQYAEHLGFRAVWLRDVPFNVPSFGDAGQCYDPFVYLGLLAGKTQTIALGVASIVLPLRHPAHVAKAAASVDALSEGRLLLGVASGDRPTEYPAMQMGFDDRGKRFQESYEYIRKMSQTNPRFKNAYGDLDGHIDMLPKPDAGKIPMLITGGSQQSKQWLAQHGDGWMTYPRPVEQQAASIQAWRASLGQANRPNQPVMQPLYFDLNTADNAQPEPIHLGFRSGTAYLVDYLRLLEKAGVNHVAINLRFNQAETHATLEQLAENVLTVFHT